jgi:hypothetical protein
VRTNSRLGVCNGKRNCLGLTYFVDASKPVHVPLSYFDGAPPTYVVDKMPNPAHACTIEESLFPVGEDVVIEQIFQHRGWITTV